MHFASRRALFAAAALLAPLATLSRGARAQGQPQQPPSPQAAPQQATGPHRLPDLPYALDANQAAIDPATMGIHWRGHHQRYVQELNDALRDHERFRDMPLERLLAGLDQVPEEIRTKVRNNGGGHANHSMFWQLMGGRGGEPSGELAQAIARDFSNFATFRNRFNEAATGIFGSGWAFVTVNRDGGLDITTRPNQDTPLMDGTMVLMGNDVWEHAYYLRYQNRRAEYVTNWWNVLHWDRIGERYAAARAGRLTI